MVALATVPRTPPPEPKSAGPFTVAPPKVVAAGKTSPAAMQEKAAHVTGVMRDRLKGLKVRARDVSVVNVYTVHPLAQAQVSAILKPDLATHGLHWHYCRPPITKLEFEMDMRGVATELYGL